MSKLRFVYTFTLKKKKTRERVSTPAVQGHFLRKFVIFSSSGNFITDDLSEIKFLRGFLLTKYLLVLVLFGQ